MKLKSIPESIMIYGDINHRDAKCPLESNEQITFVSWVRKNYPDTHGITLYHPKNEGKLIRMDSLQPSQRIALWAWPKARAILSSQDRQRFAWRSSA
jgi:hypothetical protein